MKAIVYTRYGPPSVLDVVERPQPVCTEGDVLVRVMAAEATKSDCELRSFRFPVKWFWLPLRLAFGITRPRRQILGGYFAGVVQEVGSDVTTFSVGQEIYGGAGLRLGAYGQYVCLPADSTIAPKPRNMSFDEAAAVPLGGLNAIHFMNVAGLKAGESILINGAGGSIGLFALQIAKARGAVVTAVDSAPKAELLRSLGADEVLDYAQTDFTKTGQTWDVVFDMVAGSSYAASLSVVNSGGRYLLGNPSIAKMCRTWLTNWFTDKTASFAFAAESMQELEALTEMIEAEQVVSALDQVLPMEAAAEAHTRVQTEARLGSVVISLAR